MLFMVVESKFAETNEIFLWYMEVDFKETNTSLFIILSDSKQAARKFSKHHVWN